MAHVVFLRAANVGGRNVFRPAQLAQALAHLEVVNVGAAGTFVVRGRATREQVRRAVLAELPFTPQLAIRPGREVLALARSEPFRGMALSRDARAWVAVLGARARSHPDLPLTAPPGRDWSVRFDRVAGAYAMGVWRRRPGGFVFPGQVVEKALGVPATVRWWETILRTARVLEGGPEGGQGRAAGSAPRKRGTGGL